MRVALIGLGVMGRNHLRVLQALPSVDEIVVHDVAEQQIEDSRKVQFVASVDQLVASKPDYAVVAIPTTYHAATAIALAKAGIATLLEKPVASTLAESEQIAQAFEDSQTLCAVGHIERFNPALQALKAKMSEGVVGDVLSISSVRMGPFPSRVTDVGVVLDLGSHDIDLAMWLTGLGYQDVYSLWQKTRGLEHEDLFVLIGRLGSEIVVSHSVNWLNPIKVRQTSVLGTKGLLVADSVRAELRFFEHGVANSEWQQYSNMRGDSEGSELRYPVPVREPLVAQHEAMISSVQQSKILELCSIQEGLKVMRVIKQVLGE
jgi:predicted dehydrogenase